MKRFLLTLAALWTASAIGLAVPAWAWHVNGVTAECSGGQRTVTVTLTDAGPGTYTDNAGNSGQFGATKTFSYDASGFDGGALKVDVFWFTEESASFTTELPPCETPTPSTTTTTVPVPPTTLPAPTTTTTLTAPPSTSTTSPYVSPPPNVPAGPVVPELPQTGTRSDVLGVIGITGAVLLMLGLSLYRRGGRV